MNHENNYLPLKGVQNHLELPISPRILEIIRMTLMGYSRAKGKLMHEKPEV
jgi:hypothetical protein